MRKNAAPVVAITLGDPSGIGPEVVAKTLRDPRLPKGFRFKVLGKETGRGIHLGKSSLTAAQGALSALQEASIGCLEERFAAMVTGPVHKSAMARIQPDFIGQTEFLARACGLPDEAAVMVLTDPKLTVALCTNHCSIRDAISRLTPERIIYVAKITQDFLQKSGQVRRGRAHRGILGTLPEGSIPKTILAFAAINPHMGEAGLWGDEDDRIVQPAVLKLIKENIALIHQPADTIFYYAVQKKAYDAVICAYHDQGLIPFKLVAFQTGVNVTLGLPIIRTSPDHGTALEIAGKGVADHRSMLAAVQLACRLVKAKYQGNNAR